MGNFFEKRRVLLAIFALVFPFLTFGSAITVETLSECERKGKRFCYTGEPLEDRTLINAAIEQNPQIRQEFLAMRPTFWRENDDIRIRKRRAEDCSSVCCSTVEDSPLFSYFRDRTGWQEVANTPEYPQRVSFKVEKCINAGGLCRGVQSTDPQLRAQCVEIRREHKIYLYNKQSRQINERNIELPAGCRCNLIPLNPYAASNTRPSNGAQAGRGGTPPPRPPPPRPAPPRGRFGHQFGQNG